ncbi:MAG: tetratricopeptide repeat protein [Actinomycetota bacterium]|nr:tetratricopeptide repeat protein [Actinomycetota bacterium]
MTPRFRILGRTGFRVGGRFDDNWGSTRLRGILAVLLLHAGQSISFETLIEWVWPDDQGPERDATFHTYANRIRSALSGMANPPALMTRDRSIRLDVDRSEVDYFDFRRAVDRATALATRGDHEAAVSLLVSALENWTETPLLDAKGERARNWSAAAERTHLVHAHETLMRALSALGRHDEVLRRWSDLPLEHQSNLTLVKRRLDALHGAGFHTEGITFHLDVRKRLLADFNHDEADELKRFHDGLDKDEAKKQMHVSSSHRRMARVRLLPHDINDFTGRADLLDQLNRSVANTNGRVPSGILMLAGAPGVGKTSLVVHWAHQIADRFSAVLYADLKGFSGGVPVDPAEVVTSFLGAFDFPVERIPHMAGRVAKLRNFLDGDALVILDNAAGADAVMPLLECFVNCMVVVTSRRGLSRVTRRGALAVRVLPLGQRESVAWLTSRLGHRAHNEPEAVRRLSAICDGSPLALRSVVDHVTTRPGVRLAEFVEELRTTANLLNLGDDGDGSESIRKIFSWSYEALAEDDRRMFRLLGLHPGPDLGVEAAAALCGCDTETARRSLDTLVHANLLTQPHSRGRYEFHDIIRRFAREHGLRKEHRGEREAAEKRLFDFFLHSATAADATVFPFRPSHPISPPAEGVTPLRFDSDEQAMAWCARERVNLMSLTHHAASRKLHEYALRLPTTSGEMLQRLGYYDDVLSALDIAIRAARLLGDTEAEADTVSNLGFVHVLLRDFVSAESCLRAAGDLYNRIDNVVGGAIVLHLLARLRVEQKRYREGIDLNRAALAKLRGQGVEGLEIIVLYRLAEAHRHAKDLGTATSFCRDALWLAEKIADERAQSRCLTELGAIGLAAGDLVLARGYCQRALPVHERLRDHYQTGKTYLVLSALHREQGNLREAERSARRAAASCRQARHVTGELDAYDMLGHLLKALGRTDEAAEAWSKALAIAEDVGDDRVQMLRHRSVATRHTEVDETTTRLDPSAHS